ARTARLLVYSQGLFIGQPEGQGCNQPISLVRRDHDPGGRQGSPCLARLGQRQLQGQQLVEGQAVQRGRHVGGLLGKVRCVQCVSQCRQLAPLAIGEGILQARERSLQ